MEKNPSLIIPPRKCPKCSSKYSILVLQIISSGKPFPYPKYIPQIKQMCANCEGYIQFVKQTPELIGKFNQKLESIKLEGIKCG